jgi:plastocyanin
MNRVSNKIPLLAGLILLFALLLSVGACSSTSTTTNPPATKPSNNTLIPASSPASAAKTITLNVIAQSMAFDQKTLTVPAGAQVTINFDNKDSGIPHNIAFYTDSTASTKIFVGSMITGPGTTTYTFTAPTTPGTYFFRCDVHPTQMKGQFIVQ